MTTNPWFKITKISPWYEIYEMKIYAGKKFYPYFSVVADGDKIRFVRLKAWPTIRSEEDINRFVEISDGVIEWVKKLSTIGTFTSLAALREFLLEGYAEKKSKRF